MSKNFLRAKNGTRTRDPNLGKVMLYQLSYFRVCGCKYTTVIWFVQAVEQLFSAKNLTILVNEQLTDGLSMQKILHGATNLQKHRYRSWS